MPVGTGGREKVEYYREFDPLRSLLCETREAIPSWLRKQRLRSLISGVPAEAQWRVGFMNDPG